MQELINETLLVIAPHPDDEIIGCAGLMQKVKENNGKVYVLFLTNGNTNDFTSKGISTQEEREEEIEEVAKFLDYDNYEIFFKGDKFHLKLDTIGQGEIMEAIERKSLVSINKIKPSIVAFPSSTSYNQDHRIASFSSHAALRPAPKNTKHNVRTILEYEEAVDVWSLSKNNLPNFFSTLTKENVEKKMSALEIYKSQNRPFPNMRSDRTLKSLAILRGSEVGEEFAEAFFLRKHEV